MMLKMYKKYILIRLLHLSLSLSVIYCTNYYLIVSITLLLLTESRQRDRHIHCTHRVRMCVCVYEEMMWSFPVCLFASTLWMSSITALQEAIIRHWRTFVPFFAYGEFVCLCKIDYYSLGRLISDCCDCFVASFWRSISSIKDLTPTSDLSTANIYYHHFKNITILKLRVRATYSRTANFTFAVFSPLRYFLQLKLSIRFF